MRVDFPDPFGPTRPMTPAAGSSTVSRSRAVIGPNRRVRSVVVTTDMGASWVSDASERSLTLSVVAWRCQAVPCRSLHVPPRESRTGVAGVGGLDSAPTDRHSSRLVRRLATATWGIRHASRTTRHPDLPGHARARRLLGQLLAGAHRVPPSGRRPRRLLRRRTRRAAPCRSRASASSRRR